MSGPGDELRALASNAARAAEQASNLSRRFGPLARDIVSATNGYGFEGPLARDMRSRAKRLGGRLDTAEQQMAQAAGRLAGQAVRLRLEAVWADVVDRDA